MEGDFIRKKIQGKWKGLALLLSVLPLAGCGTGNQEQPVYEMVQEADGYSLCVGDITYHRKTYRTGLGEGDPVSESGSYQWIFTEGVGEKTGVYHNGSRTYAVCPIRGDEHRDFLYSEIDGFRFGPRDSSVWIRDGVELGEPDAGMVSEIRIENRDGALLGRIQDTDRIKELLDAYENGNRILHPEKVDDWQLYTLALCHAKYPFLRYEIEGIFSPSQELAGCHNDYSKGRESLKLPEEWAELFKSIKTEG